MRWSFDEQRLSELTLPIETLVCVGDEYPYGSTGKIIKVANTSQIITEGWKVEDSEYQNDIWYWIEYEADYESQYVCKSLLYPVPIE